MKFPLEYPAVLKQRVVAGEITEDFAISWLTKYGLSIQKAQELYTAA